MRKNITVLTDAYKITHPIQRPQNINHLYSYGEPRVGGVNKKLNWFSLQAIIQEYLLNCLPTKEDIQEGYEECVSTFGEGKYFQRDIWEKVRELGYFPLKIMSAPEGTILNEGNACFTIESTEPWFANMISHFEDILMWSRYGTDVATRSMNIKSSILPYFQKSCPDLTKILMPIAVNDFGLRGVTCYEEGVLGGMAHLIHFDGSDNMPASMMLKDFYNYKGKAKSVWATEHSVATSYGPGRGEFEYVIAQLSQFTDKIKSIVIDSYDADNFMQNVVGSEEIKALIAKHTGRIVWRNDSGDPLRQVSKYSDVLVNHFGMSINNEGYRVINSNQGLIQGDGMTEESIPQLYQDYLKIGWSAGNLLTGSGGGLLTEGLTRDRQRWAIKASYGEKDGIPFDIRKTPKTDMSKMSKGGKLKLHPTGANFLTIESSKESPQNFNSFVDIMRPLYDNGLFYKDSFENIINRARI